MEVKLKPGIYANISDEDYHAGPGVSKSQLWTLYTKTPAHLKYGERKESAAFDFGKAVHCAVLEPHRFETAFKRGPEDRRGKKWTEALADADGAILLPEPEYLHVLHIQDTLQSDPMIASLTKPGALVEHSAYWTSYDPIELCKCRPDLWRPEIGVMLDLKTTADAGRDAFSRSVAAYGYHVQQAWYHHGWEQAGGGDVHNFIFLAIEKEPPYAYALYELDAEARAEGAKVMNRALSEYAACKVSGRWPGYPQPVQELSLPKFNPYKAEDLPL